MGIAEEIQSASRSSSSGLVLSRDSIDRELREELKDLLARSDPGPVPAEAPPVLLFLSEGPELEPELPDLPTA